MQEFVDRFKHTLLAIDRVNSRKLVEELEGVFSPLEIVEQLIVPGLTEIGDSWETGRVSLSQVYMSGRICEELLSNLLPDDHPNRKRQPSMAVATLNDHHMLGKSIVYSVLRAEGFELLDYGRVEVDDLLSRVKADKLEILLISTLILPSALQVKKVTEKLAASKQDVKVVVGGAPFRFDDNLWREVRADAMGWNASDAGKIITGLLREGES